MSKVIFLLFYLFFFIFIFFKHLYWSITALQWCVCFCFITKLISYTYTYIPISPPSCVSLPPSQSHPPQAVTKHRADLPALCDCFPLAIYLMFGSVYMSMPLSHFVTAYPSPSPYSQVHSLVGLCLYFRPALNDTYLFECGQETGGSRSRTATTPSSHPLCF